MRLESEYEYTSYLTTVSTIITTIHPQPPSITYKYLVVVYVSDIDLFTKLLDMSSQIRETILGTTPEYIGEYKVWVLNSSSTYHSQYTVLAVGQDNKTLSIVMSIYTSSITSKNVEQMKLIAVDFLDGVIRGSTWTLSEEELSLISRIPIEYKNYTAIATLYNGVSIGYAYPTSNEQNIYMVVPKSIEENIREIFKGIYGIEPILQEVSETTNYVLYKIYLSRSGGTITETVTTTIITNALEIVDVCLIAVHMSDTNATLYLQIKVRNLIDTTVTITGITVDNITPVEAERITGMELRPGETYATCMRVLEFNPQEHPEWESGTEHSVVITYRYDDVEAPPVKIRVVVR